MFYVNETKIEQMVLSPGRQALWIKPGECVEGDHYKQFSKCTARNAPLTPRETTKAKVIAKAGDQVVEAVAAALDANPELAAAVEAKREERAKPGPKPAPKIVTDKA